MRTHSTVNKVGRALLIEQTSGPTLPRRIETTIRARVSAAQSETFGTVDDLGVPSEEQERLIISWFTESGDVDVERTSFISGAVELADATENEWEPDNTEDYPRDTSEIVIVVRDSRGGVSWLRGLVGLEASP